MDEFVTLDIIWYWKLFYKKRNAFVFSKIVMVMLNWWQDFVSSNSICNHTRD